MKEGIINFVKDLIFPVFCVECGGEGEWWCGDCLKKVKIAELYFCPVCVRETKMGEVCPKCKAVSKLDGITALFSYKERNPIAALIQNFKYKYARDLEVLWRRIISSYCHSQVDFFRKEFFGGVFGNFTVVPVPLHSRRERERGFNQSQVLAKIIAGNLTLKLDDANLRRIRYTIQQAKLSGEERRRNLENVFAWTGSDKAPTEVLLVDDVFTTGTTMQACAKVLKSNGTRYVWGWALARD